MNIVIGDVFIMENKSGAMILIGSCLMLSFVMQMFKYFNEDKVTFIFYLFLFFTSLIALIFQIVTYRKSKKNKDNH